MNLRASFSKAGAAVALASALFLGAPVQAQTAGSYTAELSPGVVFEVLELRRMPDKGVVQLKFAVANNTQLDTSLEKQGVARSFQLDYIELIDFASKKAHKIGEAARCLCSMFSNGGPLAAGERKVYWAWFSLPPAGVRAVSVQVSNQPPILDVPLI